MNYDFIVLQTDFGLNDHFVSVVKGVIYTINPEVRIIDLTHQIQPQNIMQAGFLLKHSHVYFPARSIFVSIVDPGVGTGREIILLQKGNQIFLAPDNGLLTLVADDPHTRAYQLTIPNKYLKHPVSQTFHARDIFAPMAAYLSKGISIKTVTRPIPEMKKLEFPDVKLARNEMTGSVIYVDHFGNLITNITKDLFFEFIKLKGTFYIQVHNHKITALSRNYSIREKAGALFNSFDLLEIFSPGQEAAQVLKASGGEEVRVLTK
ncbi:MAG: SAM-dependent chlorinase/fluorinase [bacterium]|nr:SAM-dependent chlorinase/fluorinase [bacterium]